MTYLLVLFVASVPWLAARSLTRLWSALPDGNLDIALTPADLDLERRP